MVRDLSTAWRMLGRILLMALLFFLGAVAIALPAQADTTVTLSTQQSILFGLNMVIGVVLPLISQAVTNTQASDSVKTIVNLLIAAIVGVITPFATGQTALDNINWAVLGLSVVQIWLLSVVSHYGLWKPTNVTGPNGAIANALPGGIGTSTEALSPAFPTPTGSAASPDVNDVQAAAGDSQDGTTTPPPSGGAA